MKLPEDLPEEHSYTSCSDEQLNNRGYCRRCDQIAFYQRDVAAGALEWIALQGCRCAGDCGCQTASGRAIIKRALETLRETGLTRF